MKKNRSNLYFACLLFAIFLLWTAAICVIDVQPISPNGSSVGFAAWNQFIHSKIGVHMWLYTITDWLGLIPVFFIMAFGILGLIQWINRRHIGKVDFSILVLGGFYIVVLAAYLLFEEIVVNYRPVLIDGYLEASYPSSTTMLTLCVMPTAMMQLKERIKNVTVKRVIAVIIAIFTAFMVIGRLISGVHWFTDIIGGVLLSGSLVMGYRYVCGFGEK